MTTQLRLFDRREDAARLRKAMLRAAAEVVDRVGPKVIAPELDMSPSQLRDCLAERDRHYLSLADLCVIATYDEAGTMLTAHAEVAGYEAPVRKPQLDDTQKLERLLRSIAKAGPAGQALLEDAFGPGAKP